VNGTGQPDAVVSGQLERPTALAINFTGKQIVDSLSGHATFLSYFRAYTSAVYIRIVLTAVSKLNHFSMSAYAKEVLMSGKCAR